MKSVLFINACARENSRTKSLADRVLKKLGGSIKEIDLYGENIKPLARETLQKRDELIAKGGYDDEMFCLAKEFANADTIVVAAPYWDLSFPSILKVYFENISVLGITFDYTKEGFPIGLCRAEKLYYVTTAGGYIGENNLGFDYVKALSHNLFGIKEFEFIKAEGLDIEGADVRKILDEAKI
ncbi:MAG: NAD(P)H-dependent oxidoreductase [Clostridia bacterium]|nr:NAD(P)H-dependent oxidoreductase [Clostridia bacterium]